MLLSMVNLENLPNVANPGTTAGSTDFSALEYGHHRLSRVSGQASEGITHLQTQRWTSLLIQFLTPTCLMYYASRTYKASEPVQVRQIYAPVSSPQMLESLRGEGKGSAALEKEQIPAKDSQPSPLALKLGRERVGKGEQIAENPYTALLQDSPNHIDHQSPHKSAQVSPIKKGQVICAGKKRERGEDSDNDLPLMKTGARASKAQAAAPAAAQPPAAAPVQALGLSSTATGAATDTVGTLLDPSFIADTYEAGELAVVFVLQLRAKISQISTRARSSVEVLCEVKDELNHTLCSRSAEDEQARERARHGNESGGSDRRKTPVVWCRAQSRSRGTAAQ
eukprot:1918949-Rhodomonas_salina.2